MKVELIVKLVILALGIILGVIYRGIVAGITIGGLAAVAYFTWTGSALKWKKG
jgi:hypothetical protein